MTTIGFVVGAFWIAGTYTPPCETNAAAFFAEAQNDVVIRRFNLDSKPIVRALWRVAAPGMRDLFVNGARISSTALAPLTPYRKRILEESFDVTGCLKPGCENELSVELGNGWWNLLPLEFWYRTNLRNTMAQGTPCVRAILEISYADGGSAIIETDERWLAAKGRVVKNSIYLGVSEDARLNCRTPCGFARRVDGPPGRIVPARSFPKTVIYDRWKARSVSRVGKNAWIVDFGVNFAGTFRASLHGVPAGRKIRFRSGELKNADGSVNVMTAVAGQIKKAERGPLFDVAEQRDTWISGGHSGAVFEPRFTFHVFRYLQVEGLECEPSPQDFEALAWSADVADVSHFVCSDSRINLLHEVCRRTFRANLQSIQSDCPGREKFGYGGDIACTAESFRLNYAMHAFYRKTLRDFLDEAEDDGVFTQTAPYVGINGAPVLPKEECGGRIVASLGWAFGVPELLDVLVRYDGDVEALVEAYPALVRYIDRLSARYPDDVLPPGLGDWIAIDKADERLTSLAFWYSFLTKTAGFARRLGREDDFARLSGKARRVAESFRTRYVRNARVGHGSQGGQFFALHLGLLDPSDSDRALSIAKFDIERRGNALSTGIFGTRYLLEYLSSHGEAELAGKVVMHPDCPGYFHMLNRGATTLWEHWKEEQCLDVHSNCHPMFGSVDAWLLRYVLGIAICDDAVGCDRVRIIPHAVCGLKTAEGWLDTPKGRIEVLWRMTDGGMQVERKIPSGIEVVE